MPENETTQKPEQPQSPEQSSKQEQSQNQEQSKSQESTQRPSNVPAIVTNVILLLLVCFMIGFCVWKLKVTWDRRNQFIVDKGTQEPPKEKVEETGKENAKEKSEPQNDSSSSSNNTDQGKTQEVNQ